MLDLINISLDLYFKIILILHLEYLKLTEIIINYKSLDWYLYKFMINKDIVAPKAANARKKILSLQMKILKCRIYFIYSKSFS